MRKKKWIILILMISISTVLGVFFFLPKRQEGRQNQLITRAQAAKSVALLMSSGDEIQTLTGAGYYAEKDQNAWFVKYMNYMYDQGWFQTEEIAATVKAAGEFLTYQEAEHLVRQMGIENEALLNSFLDDFSATPIPKETWWWLYEFLLEAAPAEHGVEKKEILLFGTPSNLEAASSWQAYTDQEVLGFEGLALDPYIDCRLEIFVKQGEILGVVSSVDGPVVYENVWITNTDENQLRIFLNGVYRTFKVENFSSSITEVLADLVVTDGNVTQINLKKDIIKGKVLLVNEDGIEVEGYGLIPLADKFHVYQTYGSLIEKGAADILVGYDVQEFVVAKGMICAVIMKESADAQTIRVLLTTSGFQSIYHEGVTLTSDGAVTLQYGETETSYGAGEVVELGRDHPAFLEGRIKVTAQEGHEIKLLSLKRDYGNPGYEGTIELTAGPEGILIVNELSLESYLKKVVPSEMPSSFGLEALKAQAVCARTYGYKHIQGNSYSQYGAHVDDSTKFQVYNNMEANQITNQAIKETYGQIMRFQDEVINAYYFSTSCGVTTDAAVWGANAESFPYLSGEILSEAEQAMDLSGEEAFAEFIKNTEYLSFDKTAAWYRWNTQISFANLKEKAGVGVISSLEVLERGKNGIVSRLVIHGSQGDRILENQSEVREVLGDNRQTLNKNDGTSVTGWSQLPSAFIALEPKYEGESLTGYYIYGGGFGHGVGMSQNAASSMGNVGMNYIEILLFFYEGVEIVGM